MYINVYMTYFSTPHTPTLSSSPPPPLPHHPFNTPHIPIPNIHPFNTPLLHLLLLV